MTSRKVLTIDQCFQILLNRVNGLSWQESIIKAIPARKGGQLKDSDSDEGDHGNDHHHDEDHEITDTETNLSGAKDAADSDPAATKHSSDEQQPRIPEAFRDEEVPQVPAASS